MARGAAEGAIDEPIKYPPTRAHATPVYEHGRHVGYVYRMGTGDRAWWAEYNHERLTPTPFKTKAAAVDQVQRNERARNPRTVTVREVSRPAPEEQKPRAQIPERPSRPASARKVRSSLVASAREFAGREEF